MKKKLLIIISSIVAVIAIIVIGFIIFLNTKKLKVIFIEDNQINIFEEKYNTDYIDSIKNGKLITTKEQINTDNLGTIELQYTIKNIIGIKKEYTYNVEIIDNISPVIEAKDNLETTEGKEIDLKEGLSITDNSKEKIEASIEGEYDFNTPNTYNLTYVAKDSSGNEARKDFTLTVNKKVVVEKKEESQTSSTTTQSKTNSDTTFTTSKGYSGYTKNGITYIDGVLIVNKTYSIPKSYTGGSSLKGLTSETASAFNKMQAAATLDGINIYVQSGYRSYDTQNRLYNNYVARSGQAAADTFSARPGNSEHQTGLAFDVCSNSKSSACINSNFDSTPEAAWLSANAYKYGFILRYPSGKTNETGYKYESWHFRYVGVDLATKLYNNGDWITLESYFGITSQY